MKQALSEKSKFPVLSVCEKVSMPLLLHASLVRSRNAFRDGLGADEEAICYLVEEVLLRIAEFGFAERILQLPMSVGFAEHAVVLLAAFISWMTFQRL